MKYQWFCEYTTEFDEQFIGTGKTAKQAFDELKGLWLNAVLENCHFYRTIEEVPFQVAVTWKQEK